MENAKTSVMIRFSIILFGLIHGACTYAQDQPKTLLWKVTKKGIKNQSYLFGTFHEANPSFVNSLTNAKNKLSESDILFVEQKISTGQPRIAQTRVTWNFEKWHAILTKEQQAIFREFVEKIADTTCYSQSPFELLLGITRNYMQTFCKTDSGFNELMDNYIENLALQGNKQVYSLDNNQQHIIEETSDRLKKSQDTIYASNCTMGMKSTLEGDTAACAFITAYRNLDINYNLDSMVLENAANKSLLVDRNNHWILTLNKAFASRNCFVAVGYMHLCFKQGLIQQLRKLGYTVTPVPSKISKGDKIKMTHLFTRIISIS